MSYRNYKRNLSKIKLKTPKEHTTITGIKPQTSRYHSEIIHRYDFANGKTTYADPVMDNYKEKWQDIVAKAEVGDGLMDLQEDPKYPGVGIYSGDSSPMLVKKAEWDRMLARKKQEEEKKANNPGHLKVLERLKDENDPQKISGISQPQIITLEDDTIFEIARKLQDSNDKVNIIVMPGGLGLEICGPNIWLVLAREKSLK